MAGFSINRAPSPAARTPWTKDHTRAFAQDMMARLVERADIRLRPGIPSRTLREGARRRILNVERGGTYYADFYIPHYWAVMVHDGHKPFGPSRAKFLVYFRDDADDPRKPNPERVADWRPLERQDFEFGLAENRRRFQLNPSGGWYQYMVIVKNQDGSPGMVGYSRPQPFFEREQDKVNRALQRIARELFRSFVEDHYPRGGRTIKVPL